MCIYICAPSQYRINYSVKCVHISTFSLSLSPLLFFKKVSPFSQGVPWRWLYNSLKRGLQGAKGLASAAVRKQLRNQVMKTGVARLVAVAEPLLWVSNTDSDANDVLWCFLAAISRSSRFWSAPYKFDEYYSGLENSFRWLCAAQKSNDILALYQWCSWAVLWVMKLQDI